MEVSSSNPVNQSKQQAQNLKVNNPTVFPEILKTTATNIYAIAPNQHMHQLEKDKLKEKKSNKDYEEVEDEPSIREQVTKIINKIKQLKTAEDNQWEIN